MAPPDCGGVKVLAHSPTLLTNPSVLVWAGECQRTLSATIYLTRGLAVVHGPGLLTPPHPIHRSPAVPATQLSHSLLHSHRGVLQVSLVLLQGLRAQS